MLSVVKPVHKPISWGSFPLSGCFRTLTRIRETSLLWSWIRKDRPVNPLSLCSLLKVLLNNTFISPTLISEPLPKIGLLWNLKDTFTTATTGLAFSVSGVHMERFAWSLPTHSPSLTRLCLPEGRFAHPPPYRWLLFLEWKWQAMWLWALPFHLIWGLINGWTLVDSLNKRRAKFLSWRDSS